MKPASAPVAVFDSGIGGLTVVSALRRELPGEHVIYLGDTARVPYGGKSRATIERYSEEIARFLVAQGAKMVVVACNTASALALPRLRDMLDVPVEGVIAPGVEAALSATRSGHVAVIGTKATIGSSAYAGLPPGYASPHGQRSGFLTQAALDGAPLAAAMKLSLHRSAVQAQRYYADVEITENPATDLLG